MKRIIIFKIPNVEKKAPLPPRKTKEKISFPFMYFNLCRKSLLQEIIFLFNVTLMLNTQWKIFQLLAFIGLEKKRKKNLFALRIQIKKWWISNLHVCSI